MDGGADEMMDGDITIPKPPTRLRAAGRQRWRDAWQDYEFTFAEIVDLTSACHQEDELVRLVAALAKAPVMIEGSAGQSVVNPLFAAVDAKRAAQTKHLHALGIADTAAAADAGTAKSSAGRSMARLRWGQRGA